MELDLTDVYTWYLAGYVRVRSGNDAMLPGGEANMLGYALGVARGCAERLPECKVDVMSRTRALLTATGPEQAAPEKDSL